MSIIQYSLYNEYVLLKQFHLNSSLKDILFV